MRYCHKDLEWLPKTHILQGDSGMYALYKLVCSITSQDISMCLRVMTHIMWIHGDFDITNSLQYHAGFTPMLFQWSHSKHMQHFLSQIHCNFFTAQFFHSRPLFIMQFLFCRVIFHVETGCTAVCLPFPLYNRYAYILKVPGRKGHPYQIMSWGVFRVPLNIKNL